jgi:predicted DNA-binding protein with PD1-like motif
MPSPFLPKKRSWRTPKEGKCFWAFENKSPRRRIFFRLLSFCAAHKIAPASLSLSSSAIFLFVQNRLRGFAQLRKILRAYALLLLVAAIIFLLLFVILVFFMQSRKEKSGYILVLEKGEEIRAALLEWAKKEKIEGAYFWGIGAVTNVELGAYSPGKDEYLRKKFTGTYELLSVSGDINNDGVHAHLAMSGEDFAAIGGHLFSATIAVTGEFFIMPTGKLEKVPLQGSKLKVISFGMKK